MEMGEKAKGDGSVRGSRAGRLRQELGGKRKNCRFIVGEEAKRVF
jgi:hypothetical protein